MAKIRLSYFGFVVGINNTLNERFTHSVQKAIKINGGGGGGGCG